MGPRSPGRISGPQRAHTHSVVRSGSGNVGCVFPSALSGQQSVKGAVVSQPGRPGEAQTVVKQGALCRAWMLTRLEKTRGAVKSIDYKIYY